MVGPPYPPGTFLWPVRGVHVGKALEELRTDYLEWVLGHLKLSTGLRATVRSELERRGRPLPPEQRRQPVRCRECGGTALRRYWQDRRDGTRAIRADCDLCGCFVAFLPQDPENIAAADEGTSPRWRGWYRAAQGQEWAGICEAADPATAWVTLLQETKGLAGWRLTKPAHRLPLDEEPTATFVAAGPRPTLPFPATVHPTGPRRA